MTLFHSLRLNSMVPYIDIHTHHQTTDKEIISVLNRSFDEEVVSPCSVGIHPYLSTKAETDPGFISRSIKILKDKASMNEVIAIGEAGIDYIFRSIPVQYSGAAASSRKG